MRTVRMCRSAGGCRREGSARLCGKGGGGYLRHVQAGGAGTAPTGEPFAEWTVKKSRRRQRRLFSRSAKLCGREKPDAEASGRCPERRGGGRPEGKHAIYRLNTARRKRVRPGSADESADRFSGLTADCCGAAVPQGGAGLRKPDPDGSRCCPVTYETRYRWSAARIQSPLHARRR